MTVSSTTNRKEYTGDGATVTFATSPVVFFDEGDLTVYKVVTATGAATLQTLTTDYTVSGGSGSTGTVTMVVAPTSAQTLVIVRELDLVQEVDFVNNEATDAEVSEDALDKLTLMAQQLDAKIDRSARLADSDVSGASVELPTPSANKLLAWNSGGTALENKAAADVPLTAVSSFIDTLLDDATAAAARATLLIGTKSSVASATTPDIWTGTGSLIDYTGTATATGFAAAPQAGAGRELLCAGAAVFTNGANFVVAGGDFTAAAGDRVLVVAETTTKFRLYPLKADGTPTVAGSKTGPGGVCQNLAVRTHASNPTYQLTIAADVADLRDTSGNVKAFSTVSLTADITASGANGLDTGSEAGNTWYYVWIIGKSDGTVASLLSTSSTAPTMPSGYTFKALVGAVRNDGSSNFLAFRQFGNEVWFVTTQAVLSGGSSTTEASVSAAAVVPPIAQAFDAFVTGSLTNDGSGNVNATLSMRTVSGTNYVTYNAALFGLAASAGGNFLLPGQYLRMPNLSQTLYYLWQITNGSSPSANVSICGFKLPTGGE